MSAVRIGRWLSRRALEIEAERTKWVELRRAASGGTAPIAKKVFPPADGLTTEDYSSELFQLAEDDAGGLEPGERHSYLLVAKNGKETVSTCPFWVRLDAPELDDAGIGAAKGDAASALAASLRHTEAIFRTVVPAWTEILRSQERRSVQQDEHIERLQKSQLKTFELQEQLISKTHERELAFAEEKRKQEFQDEGISLIRAYVPTVAAMVGKKYKMLPSIGKDADPALHQLKEFLSTLTEEQFATIAATLKPAQQLLINELYVSINERVAADIDKEDEKEQSAAAKVRERMRPNGNGSH